MHATKVLQKILSSVIARLDARNVRNLLFAVEALLVGRRLTLMELACHFPGAGRINENVGQKAILSNIPRRLCSPIVVLSPETLARTWLVLHYRKALLRDTQQAILNK